jgi:hypothetical protein
MLFCVCVEFYGVFVLVLNFMVFCIGVEFYGAFVLVFNFMLPLCWC